VQKKEGRQAKLSIRLLGNSVEREAKDVTRQKRYCTANASEKPVLLDTIGDDSVRIGDDVASKRPGILTEFPASRLAGGW